MGLKKTFKVVMDENAPQLIKDINLQIQEAEPISVRIKPKKIHTKTQHHKTSKNLR